MAHYYFKYHGVSNDKAVFSLKSEDQKWFHYKMDSGGSIRRIAYSDVDLAQCNTRIIDNLLDIIEESKSNSITELASKGLLDTLKERDVQLDGIGDVALHEYKIIIPYKMVVTLTNGIQFEEKYDGVNEDDALRVAKINNPLFSHGVIIK